LAGGHGGSPLGVHGFHSMDHGRAARTGPRCRKGKKLEGVEMMIHRKLFLRKRTGGGGRRWVYTKIYTFKKNML
jgi:hypothetical protein